MCFRSRTKFSFYYLNALQTLSINKNYLDFVSWFFFFFWVDSRPIILWIQRTAYGFEVYYQKGTVQFRQQCVHFLSAFHDIIVNEPFYESFDIIFMKNIKNCKVKSFASKLFYFKIFYIGLSSLTFIFSPLTNIFLWDKKIANFEWDSLILLK